MVRPPKARDQIEVDPRGGDAILKRMLQTKPKSHDEMVLERRQQPAKKKTAGKDFSKPAARSEKDRKERR
jgi:hypothetical protein